MDGMQRAGLPPDGWVWALVLAAFLWMLGMGLSGCSRTVYVPVETVRTDTVFRFSVSSDTTWLRDSIHVEIREVNETVFVTKYKERIRWRDRIRTDTVHSTRTDSVAVPYPVERELGRWEKIRLDFGGAAIIALLSLTACVLYIFIKKRRRKLWKI